MENKKEPRKAGAFLVQGLGTLCLEGRDVASYLFQVPTDQKQWARLRQIVDRIIEAASKLGMRELPAIGKEMQQVLTGPPSIMAADQLTAGFDRIIKLLGSAQSGLFIAIP